ncbi:MAG: hypothetical protein H7Y42_14020 [Chitinophagaceae bacterium]|nr:hypothetical protein [Chitinophagaceae bacterium]
MKKSVTGNQKFARLFDYSDLPGIKEELWKWLKVAIVAEGPDARERSNFIFLYELLVETLEKIWERHGRDV